MQLKEKVAKGAIWTLCEKLSCQAVQFVVSMVLARLLTPTDYGTVALTSIFFAVTGVMVDAGFGNALVQKKDADDLDFNSVFYLNVCLSLGAYGIIFLAAPWIADFYKTPILVPVVRVAAVSFVFNAIDAVQNAELTKKMLFNLSFRISLISTFTSAIVGVAMAVMGYGVWALVWSTLMSRFAGCLARWFIIAWRPRAMFSLARLKPLFDYGWKMSVSALLDQFFANLNGLLIGKFYSKDDLAFVNKGDALPRLVVFQVDGSIGRVSFPALVQKQDDKYALRESMRRMMRCSTFLVFPLMVGLAVCSKSILLLLFGRQWVPATPYMMIACFSFALWPFHTINLNGIMALGRSDVFLKLEIIKKVAKLAFILMFFRMGVLPFVVACAFALGPLSVVVNAWPNKRLLDYTLRMQIMDVLPTGFLCAIEAGVVFGVDLVFNLTRFSYSTTESCYSLIVMLLCQFVAGGAVFCGLAYVFRMQSVREYVQLMSTLFAGRMPRLMNHLEKHFQMRDLGSLGNGGM